jgi:hypothetical protein
MFAILGIASEYGKNCIAVERDVGVFECPLGFRVLFYITRLGYRSERFQESCGLGNRRDVMSHLHESCSTSWVQLMLLVWSLSVLPTLQFCGANAEYAMASAGMIAPKPKRLNRFGLVQF